MRFRPLAILCAALCAPLLAACVSLSGRAGLAAQAQRDIDSVPAWSGPEDGVALTDLGELISSPELDALVAESLAANPSLEQAWTTLRIRQAEQRVVGAARLPTVELSATGSREQHGDDLYASSVQVSWELDLWGKLADDYHAAGRDVEEQEALYLAARDTLAADVMETWLGVIADQRAIEIQQRRLATLDKNAAFIL